MNVLFSLVAVFATLQLAAASRLVNMSSSRCELFKSVLPGYTLENELQVFQFKYMVSNLPQVTRDLCLNEFTAQNVTTPEISRHVGFSFSNKPVNKEKPWDGFFWEVAELQTSGLSGFGFKLQQSGGSETSWHVLEKSGPKILFTLKHEGKKWKVYEGKKHFREDPLYIAEDVGASEIHLRITRFPSFLEGLYARSFSPGEWRELLDKRPSRDEEQRVKEADKQWGKLLSSPHREGEETLLLHSGNDGALLSGVAFLAHIQRLRFQEGARDQEIYYFDKIRKGFDKRTREIKITKTHIKNGAWNNKFDYIGQDFSTHITKRPRKKHAIARALGLASTRRGIWPGKNYTL